MINTPPSHAAHITGFSKKHAVYSSSQHPCIRKTRSSQFSIFYGGSIYSSKQTDSGICYDAAGDYEGVVLFGHNTIQLKRARPLVLYVQK